MKKIPLEPINPNKIPLKPSDNIIPLSSVLPYLTLDSINVPDRQRNSHQKTLHGSYYGPTPTSIRIRNHYPHSISSNWLRLSYTDNKMYTDGDHWGFVNNTLSTPAVIKYGNALKYSLVEGSQWQCANGAWDKEEAFWGTEDTIMTHGGYNFNRSIKYSNPLVYKSLAPIPDEEDYYFDTTEATGYPYTSPSNWISATINSQNKTWVCDIVMNQWWHNVSTGSYQQMIGAKKVDDRLQFIELQYNFEVGDEIETASRVYYIWHCPQNWGDTGTLELDCISGLKADPSGQHICPLGLGFNGCHFDYGWNVAGGEFNVSVGSIPLDFSAIELDSLYPHKKTGEDPPFGLINPPYVSLAWTLENTGQIVEAYAHASGYSNHYLNIARMSIVDGFIYSEEFQEDFSEFNSMPDETEYDITFVIDFSTKIIGNSADIYAHLSNGENSYYGWCTKSPSCSEYCIGYYSGSGGLSFFNDDETYLEPADAWTGAGGTVYAEIMGAGADQTPALLKEDIGSLDVHIFGSGSDGGRTRLYFGQNLQTDLGEDRGKVIVFNKFGEYAKAETVSAIGETGWKNVTHTGPGTFPVINSVKLSSQNWIYNVVTHVYEKVGAPYDTGFYGMNFNVLTREGLE